MFQRNATEVTKDIFHLTVSTTSLGAAKVIEPCHTNQDVIDQGDDNGDEDRVEPDDDNGNDGCVTICRLNKGAGWIGEASEIVTRKPTKDTEES